MRAQRSSRPMVMHAACVLFLVWAVSAHAGDQATEEQVKAAYLYNFLQFVEWPAENNGLASMHFRACVLGDVSFAATFASAVSSKSVRGRAIDVVSIRMAEEAKACQVAFVGSSSTRQVLARLPALRDAGVLTVGEAGGFLENGGIINFVAENDHVRFQVNYRAAGAARLHISARLLQVAEVVLR